MNQEKLSARAIEIAELIISQNFAQAYRLLAADAQDDFTLDSFQQAYQEMVAYFYEDGAKVNITLGEVILEDLGDDEVSAFVPVLSNNQHDEFEALTMLINSDFDIIEFDFGRP
ncbi:MAG: hypothetical protein HWE13_15655 [Gammaproteobacteria bacterium]|nr:hypothetical protein [Gammaproteobacteria bacterium]